MCHELMETPCRKKRGVPLEKGTKVETPGSPYCLTINRGLDAVELRVLPAFGQEGFVRARLNHA